MKYLVLAALLGCHSPELVTALARGDIATANQLLDHHADLAAEDESGDSALMLATWHGDAALVKRMILAGADPNHANAFGATALHWAVDDPDKVRVLLDAGANPNARDSTDATPLARAAERDGNTDTIAMMLAHGADPKLVGDRLGGDAATLPALIAGGAPTKHALIYAAIAGHVDAVEVLLARHVDPNTTGNLGMTALMWAAEQGYTDVVEALLAGGANPNIVASFNRSTALIHAA
ncbi:MAG TPA: ankyrin repeat domain-containing protein, partial [Kofleriaceae bacterium]